MLEEAMCRSKRLRSLLRECSPSVLCRNKMPRAGYLKKRRVLAAHTAHIAHTAHHTQLSSDPQLLCRALLLWDLVVLGDPTAPIFTFTVEIRSRSQRFRSPAYCSLCLAFVVSASPHLGALSCLSRDGREEMTTVSLCCFILFCLLYLSLSSHTHI